MTDNNAPADDVVAPENGWVLIKRGLYWRPDGQGYTGILSRAGLYSEAESAKWADHGHDPEVTRMRFRDAPEVAKATFVDIARDYWREQALEARAEIERLRAERDKVYEALSDLCDKHHCLPGVNQIEFLDSRLSRLTAAQLRIRELEDGLNFYANEDAYQLSEFSKWYPLLEDSGRRARSLIERNSK